MKTLAFAVVGALVIAGGAAHAADATKELAEQRAAIAARSDATKADLAAAHYRLGLWAKERGFADDARLEFQAAVVADASHEAAHKELGDVKAGDAWVARDEAMRLKGLVERGGAWILKEEAAILDLPQQEKVRRQEEQEKTSKLLRTYAAASGPARKFAADALAGVDDRYKLEPLAWGLRAKTVDVRLYAAKELGRIGDRRGLRPLLWRAIHDPDAGVRVASVAAAKAIGDPNLLAPFVAALNSDTAKVRMNAVEGIAEIGDRAGVQYLVWRFEAHGGGAPRCWYGQVNQLSFIQDFDVEVAQTAFIADPQIGVIQDGLVLDVQVVATSQVFEFAEREVVHRSLHRMTGATDVKNEPGAWAAWWKDHKKDYVASSR
jgi:hypothetical protein